MAQQGFKLESDKVCCSICLDLLKDPVTIPCGHSYCMSCIKSHWDAEDEKHIHSCPQCRQSFVPRPVLMKSTMLAELVEDLKKTGLQAAPADHCYAGPEDVACDFCAGRRLKAVKSCLQCLVSYCELHLQPHHEVAALKRHKLVDPSERLQENICPDHGEVMRIFCRTDQQCICYLCSMDEHRGHDTVSAAAERTERQKELKPSCRNIQQRVKEIKTDMMVLQQEVGEIGHSADKAVKHSEGIFADLICLIEKGISDIKQQIRSQQKTEVSRVKELLQQLEEELTELERKQAELEQLSRTEDHTQFLHMFPLLSKLSESTSPRPEPRPVRHFEDVTQALSAVKDKVQSILCEEWPKISRTVAEVDILLPQPEPKTRDEFLQHSCQLTLDPNTANKHLLLSDGNRRATWKINSQTYPSHPDRFMNRSQVLGRERLAGRHYWEVEWTGIGVFIAVAYEDVSRTGEDSEFGQNDASWALDCSNVDYNFFYNKSCTPISAPVSSRIGVYLDHRAGILSFYSVSDTMTLLYRVQTTFTQPLYVGLRAFGFLGFKSSAELCELK